MPRGSPRRGIHVARRLPALLAGAVIAVCAVGCSVPVADAEGAGAEDTGPAGEVLTAEASVEEETVRIENIVVPGPTAGVVVEASADEPNRAGSSAVPVRVYEPSEAAWAALVWAHGGSFVRGTLDWPEADWASRRFAEAGVRVYSVDYVLASDTVKAPAPANDVAAVLHWALEREELPVAVGGASAGAHLATAAALTDVAASAAASAGPAALLLQYPTLHRVQRDDAAVAAATRELPEARRFDAERIAEMYRFYLGDDEGSGPAAAGRVVPVGELGSDRLAGLPPTVIVNADADDLRASGEQFAEQLAAAGVPVVEAMQPGTVHGYLNRPDETPQAGSDATVTIGRFVDALRAILAAA